MNFIKTKSHLYVLGIALLTVLSTNLAAQTPKDESQTAPTIGAIRGRVVTPTGQPVNAATVFVRGSAPFFQPRTTATDSAGNFEVSGLTAELYSVSASAPGYISMPRDPDSPPVYHRIGDSVEVSLVKGGVVTGAVMTATGEPVVQVSVRAIMVRDAYGQPPRFPMNQPPRATDDRGVFRIYGLLPGTYLVAAGGRNSFGVSTGAYDTDAPIFAPSSTADTATEVVVRAGEETTGVDIRYRVEAGRVVTGVVVGPIDPAGISRPIVNLTQVSNGIPLGSAFSFQPPNSKGFTFYGVSDGDYDLIAQLSGPGETLVSEPRRVTVKGADVTGIELAIKPLGSIEGRLTLQNSTAPECKDKRRPLFSETLVSARRSEKGIEKSQPRSFSFFVAQASPNKSGDFLLRSLAPGQYNLNTRFFAKYWFLRSIARDVPPTRAAPAKAGSPTRGLDIARNGLTLKSGERINGLNITLVEGAASLRGAITRSAGESLPSKLYVHLVPSEKESVDDVLRVFAAPVSSDGTFAFNNLPPGNYWALARVAADNELQLEARVRQLGEDELRLKIRRAAEAAKNAIEFKPCQNITDYQLPMTAATR